MSSQQTLVSRVSGSNPLPPLFSKKMRLDKTENAQLCTLGVVVSTNTSQFSSLLELKYPC